MTDLVRRLARGEEAAFTECYDAYANRLYHYLLVRLGTPHDAADVLQELFVRLVRHRKQMTKVRNLETYLFRMAHNEAARYQQRRVRHEPAFADTLSESRDDAAEQFEALDLAIEAMGRLTEEAREVVQLKLYAGCTFQEIADILDIPLGTVATRYRQALIDLREWLMRERLL